MIKIDFEDDETKRMETIIYGITSLKLNNSIISLGNYQDQLEFILTIMSILYKQKCYEEYIKNHVCEHEEDMNIEIIYEIIDEKKLIDATIKVKKYSFLIEPFIKQYYAKKMANYIAQKHQIGIIIDQNNQKELLRYNPLEINRLIKYIHNPLTKEERIIQHIIEFLIEAQQTYLDEKTQIKYIKDLMKRNNNKEELEEIISFIIGNSYQEVKDNLYDENRNIIIPIVENQNIKKQDIIKQFNNSEEFSNMFLKTFITYNLEIEKGHLDELKTKESKKYAKRLYN